MLPLQTRLKFMDVDFKKFLSALSESLTTKSKDEVVEEITKVVDEVPTMKAHDDEKRLFTAVVLRPEVIDSQGDIYSFDVVEKACHDYNEHCRKGNYQHLIQSDDVVMVESWVAKADMNLGDGEIHAGDWVMTSRVDSDAAWDMCKEGAFTGFSIGALTTVEVFKSADDEISEWITKLEDKAV
jgi:hypothetical protein